MSFLAQNSRTLVALSRAVGTASANNAAAAADTPSPSTALRPVSNKVILLCHSFYIILCLRTLNGNDLIFSLVIIYLSGPSTILIF